MQIRQLSIFLENKPGHLISPIAILAEAGLNILTLTLADTQNFGILRLILAEWEHAKELLAQNGFTTAVNEVLAIQVEDRPGGLKDLLQILEKENVNIEYMYAFCVRTGQKAVMIFRLDDIERGIAVLRAAGASILTAEKLFALTEAS